MSEQVCLNKHMDTNCEHNNKRETARAIIPHMDHQVVMQEWSCEDCGTVTDYAVVVDREREVAGRSRFVYCDSEVNVPVAQLGF